MTYQALTLNPDTDLFADFINQVDQKLTILGSGNPQGVAAAVLPGIFYLDRVSGAVYFCTQADGTTGGTVWVPTGLSVPVSTTTTQGIIALATRAEAAAGTNTTKAVTPDGVGAAYAKKGVNTDIIEIQGLGVPLTKGQGGTGATSYYPVPNPSGQAGKAVQSDGTNYVLASAPVAGIPVIVKGTSGDLTENNFHLITASSLTLNLPTTPTPGWFVKFGFLSTVTGTIITNGKIMNGDSTMTVDVSQPFTLIFVNSTYGWWITS